MHRDRSAIDPAGGQLRSSLWLAVYNGAYVLDNFQRVCIGIKILHKQSIVPVHVTRPTQVILMLLILISIALH